MDLKLKNRTIHPNFEGSESGFEENFDYDKKLMTQQSPFSLKAKVEPVFRNPRTEWFGKSPPKLTKMEFLTVSASRGQRMDHGSGSLIRKWSIAWQDDFFDANGKIRTVMVEKGKLKTSD